MLHLEAHAGRGYIKIYFIHSTCSWGHKWGEDGYFKLIRGKGKCGIDQGVTSAILEWILTMIKT